jgi:glucose-1-phosphate cytidylyltransferase
MKVVILAGGLGTRISEESHLRPKPMIEIGGQPILWHIMKYYSHFGFNDFIICCGYRAYVIKEYFASYYLHRSDVTFDFSRNGQMEIHSNVAEPWRVTVVDTGLNTMTGGRIKRIQPFVGRETFMMTYGDGLGTVDLGALLDQHQRQGRTVTLTAVQPGGRYGVLRFEDDLTAVTGFQEKVMEDGGWINAGFMVMEPDIFDYLDGDDCVLEIGPLSGLAGEKRLGAFRHCGFWQCMDTQRDKESLEGLWQEDRAAWKVW